MQKKTCLLLGLLCLVPNLLWAKKGPELELGFWRFELRLDHAVVPFIMELKRDEKKRLRAVIFNGKEKIELPEVNFDKGILRIPLQTYQYSLKLQLLKNGQLKGYHIRHNKSPEVRTPLEGKPGINDRFPGEYAPATISLAPRYTVIITDPAKQRTQGVVLFDQQGNSVTGSILTTTGDYRYFEGVVSGENFEAASFDGVFNYVFRGSLKDKKLEAGIYSNSITSLEGAADVSANIPNPYAHTKVTQKLAFSFPDLEGKPVSLTDKRFAGKPVIVQFFGSWCPNCMDELNFLVPWYTENKDRGVEVVALAFERSLDRSDAKRQLRKVKTQKAVPYPLLLAGATASEKPQDKIQGIENFISFPTTVFLNRQHEVVKVHAGFTGPSTGEFFEKWKKEFNQTIDELLK
jgi:thiol-disulfide isomerase/thioredoxin